MTYAEMQRAEAELRKAMEPQRRQRGATKAQLAYRQEKFAARSRATPCVYCLRPLGAHTTSEMLDCSKARS